MILPIRVYGRPAPQGSKEQGGAGQLLESSVHLPAWRAAVKVAAFEAYRAYNVLPEWLPLIPVGRPVVIDRLWFFVGPDQCRVADTDEPIGTPDIDKLLRATLDALGGGKGRTGRLFADDSQVQGIRDLWKFRATADEPPGALIQIRVGE